MHIDFFEEFPTKQNLQKLRLIRWPCLVYLAAPSLKQFLEIEKRAKKINKRIVYGYWPVLKKCEGYWISQFSQRAALIRIINELKKNKKPLNVLFDYELPFLAPFLFVSQFFNYRKNKKLIYDFLENAHKYRIKVAIAENRFSLPYNFGDKRIILAYSSDFKIASARMLAHKIESGKKFRNRLCIGLGCIAPGILKIEPKLGPKGLERDLHILKKSKIENVIIFRCGGLNKDYINVIKKYLSWKK